MNNFWRRVFCVDRNLALFQRDVRWRVRLWGRWVVFGMAVAGSAAAAHGQAPVSGKDLNFGTYVEGGLQNVQYPSYADNSLGANAGAYVQPSRLVGLEVRGGSFPVSAKYKQWQATAGWRLGLRGPEHNWMPYVYGGGGLSRAQDVNNKGQTVSAWDPCWQGSAGVDRALGDWSVRLFEVTYRKTYTPYRELRSLELTVGLVRRF